MEDDIDEANSISDHLNDCAICFSNIEDKCITPCNHEFCKNCLLLAIQHKLRRRETFICPMCRQNVLFHEIKNNGESLIPPPRSTIFGCVYVQGSCKGLASYHFNSLEDCYISYESDECSMWPDLDDGSRPPARKPFENISFDLENRVFRGSIIWAPNSWEGAKLWRYEMIFTENFERIEGGFCQQFNELGKDLPDEVDMFGVHLRYNRYSEEAERLFGLSVEFNSSSDDDSDSEIENDTESEGGNDVLPEE